MLANHRNIIIEYIDQLVEAINYEELINYLINKGLMSHSMKRILDERYEGKERNKQLFLKIMRRGPTAYDTLIEACQDLAYLDAVKLLDVNNLNRNLRSMKQINIVPSQPEIEVVDASNDNRTDTVNVKLEPYNKPIKETKYKVIHSKCIQKAKDTAHQVYKMVSKYRGVLFLVNIIDFDNNPLKKRNGAQYDKDYLLYMFKEFLFEIFYYENLTKPQFDKLYRELLESKYIQRTECFVFVLLSHGKVINGEEIIIFSDNTTKKIDDIILKLDNVHCPNLIDKPKICFFNYCRGDSSEIGLYREPNNAFTEFDGVGIIPLSSNIRTQSELYICYATTKGHRAHRNPNSGSWYIEILVEVFSKHAHDTSLDMLVKLVSKKLGELRSEDNFMQTTNENLIGNTKTLFFNPGYILQME